MNTAPKSIRKLWLDFETYYDNDFSLKKLTPLEYVLDPRFEALGCAFAWEDEPPFWIDGPDLPRFYKTVDWKNTFAISHNALFDMTILSFRHRTSPKLYGDTLGMARNWISHSTLRVSLEACCQYYGLPAKWDTLLQMKGVNYQQLLRDPALHNSLRAYGMDDVSKCREIFNRMVDEGFPQGQFEIIDMVIRMTTLPLFRLDDYILSEHLAAVKAHKQELLEACGMDSRQNLMKDAALAAMLMACGVNPPMKPSPSNPEKKIFAFAKSDKAFTALLEHDDDDVQALVAARLGHKSTIEETRTQRLLDLAKVSSEELPIPLKYSGAHTHRFSGDWHINMQNLPKRSRLRRALKAPYGWKVVSIDASQIEARLNAVLSGQDDLVEAFREGRDVYSEFASSIYNVPVTKQTQPREREVGKIGILSLGYGSSWAVFQNMCRLQGNVKLLDYQAASIVSIYRNRYAKIVSNWDWAGRTIIPILAGEEPIMEEHLQWGPLKIERNAILLPSGNRLHYRDLRKELYNGRQKWVFMRGPKFNSIYGAKLVENVIQALAFVHLMEVALRVKHLTRGVLMPSHQVHDELIYIVPGSMAERTAEFVRKEMSKPPIWMPNAPLAAEANVGDSYGEAK